MNITVYLGANKGIDNTFTTAVRELGEWIGTNGHTLVYGGSKTGLMGELAESVLMAGGRVIGVEPQFFVEAEVQYDEITEVMSKLSLNQLSAPCIFYNLNGYYDSMKEMLSHMIKMGLSAKERQKDIYFASDLEETVDVINCYYL